MVKVDKRGRDLLARLEVLGEVTQIQAFELVNEIYADGVVSEGEARGLFDLNRQLKGSDPKWERRFIEAICDFLVGPRSGPAGPLSEAQADWLITQIGKRSGAPTDPEIDLLVLVCRRAKSVPQQLSRFALCTVSEAIIRSGQATAWNIERMRQLLYKPSSDDGIWVSQFEANLLLATNDAIAFAQNDRAWNDLFTRAIANHLLAVTHPAPKSAESVFRRDAWLTDTRRSTTRLVRDMAGSFDQEGWFLRVTQDAAKANEARAALLAAKNGEQPETDSGEQGWFLRRLGWSKDADHNVSPAEKALIGFLNQEIPGFTIGLAAAI